MQSLWLIDSPLWLVWLVLQQCCFCNWCVIAVLCLWLMICSVLLWWMLCFIMFLITCYSCVIVVIDCMLLCVVVVIMCFKSILVVIDSWCSYFALSTGGGGADCGGFAQHLLGASPTNQTTDARWPGANQIPCITHITTHSRQQRVNKVKHKKTQRLQR